MELFGPGELAPMEECLPDTHKTLSLIPSTAEN